MAIAQCNLGSDNKGSIRNAVSCAGKTESRMSAQMLLAAFPGLDYDCVFV